MSGHTLGSHLGVELPRLKEMQKEFSHWLAVELHKPGMFCGCDAVKKIIEIAKTPEELGTLAYQVGGAMNEITRRKEEEEDEEFTQADSKGFSENN